jgi:hypothetical protein
MRWDVFILGFSSFFKKSKIYVRVVFKFTGVKVIGVRSVEVLLVSIGGV